MILTLSDGKVNYRQLSYNKMRLTNIFIFVTLYSGPSGIEEKT